MYDRLMTVSRGCRLVALGLVLVVAAAVLGYAGGVVLGAVAGANAGPDDAPDLNREPRAAPGLAALRLLEGGLVLAGRAVGLVGRLRCRAVPAGAGDARAWVTASAAVEAVAVLADVYAVVDAAAGPVGSPAAALAVGGAGGLLSVASLALFLLFARATAGYVRRRSLGRRAAPVLRLAAAAAGCMGLGFGLMAAGQAAGGAAPAGVCGGSLFLLAAVVLFVVTAAKAVPLLNDLGAAAAQHAERIEEWVDEYKWDDEYDRRRRAAGVGRRLYVPVRIISDRYWLALMPSRFRHNRSAMSLPDPFGVYSRRREISSMTALG